MNDRTKKRFLLVIAGSIGTLLTSTSFAADASTPATATATIDWSKLQISVTGIDGTTPTVHFSGQSTSLNSYAQSPGQYESNYKSLDNWIDTAQSQFRCRNRVRQWTRFPDRLFRNCKLDARRLLKLFRESNREFFL